VLCEIRKIRMTVGLNVGCLALKAIKRFRHQLANCFMLEPASDQLRQPSPGQIPVGI
jgi:hypothetical protein